MDTVLWAVESQQGFGKSETVDLFLEGTVGASPELVLPGAGRSRRLSQSPPLPLDQVTPQGQL